MFAKVTYDIGLRPAVTTSSVPVSRAHSIDGSGSSGVESPHSDWSWSIQSDHSAPPPSALGASFSDRLDSIDHRQARDYFGSPPPSPRGPTASAAASGSGSGSFGPDLPFATFRLADAQNLNEPEPLSRSPAGGYGLARSDRPTLLDPAWERDWDWRPEEDDGQSHG